MTKYALPTSASVLDIRAAYALAKIYKRFDLGDHDAMMIAALTSAEHYPYNAKLVEDQMMECPPMFADEPALVVCWDVGVGQHREFLSGLDEIMREAANEDEWH